MFLPSNDRAAVPMTCSLLNVFLAVRLSNGPNRHELQFSEVTYKKGASRTFESRRLMPTPIDHTRARVIRCADPSHLFVGRNTMNSPAS